jgi:hypothetical protein
MACKHLLKKLGLGFHITQIQAAKLCHEDNSSRGATIFATLAVTQSRNLQNDWKFRDFIFKISTLLSCIQNVCKNESLPDIGRQNKLSLWHLYRCHYVGRNAYLSEFPVNSRSKISKWKLLNFIQSNEGISTLEYKIHHWSKVSKFNKTPELYSK